MRWMLCLVLAALTGCHSYHHPMETRTLSETRADAPVIGKPTFGFPLSIPGQGVDLIPFAVQSEKGLFERDDPYRRVAAVSTSDYPARLSAGHGGLGGSVRWHNAIMHDLKTGEQWPILTRRGIIESWSVLATPEEKERPYRVRAILFIAVIDDTNKDGLLDNLDARVAILTGADGRGGRIVSRPDGQVWSHRYNPATDTLYFSIASDTDRDGAIDMSDDQVAYMMPIDAEPLAMPVLREAVAARVRRLLGNDDERPGETQP